MAQARSDRDNKDLRKAKPPDTHSRHRSCLFMRSPSAIATAPASPKLSDDRLMREELA